MCETPHDQFVFNPLKLKKKKFDDWRIQSAREAHLNNENNRFIILSKEFDDES